jgi:hypothetical protein
MDWVKSFTDWATQNQAVLWWLGAGSIALLLATPVVVAWLVIRLPTNYFVAKRRQRFESWKEYPALRAALVIGKNLLGVVLLVAGLVMLITPGQGLLTIVAGLMLVDFPGKFRLERSLVKRRHVWRSLNWLRKRAGRPELIRPE